MNVLNLPTSVRPSDTRVEAYYKLNEGAGDKANDTGDHPSSAPGTITDPGWETIDTNWGMRVMDENGEVMFNIGDVNYINPSFDI